MCLPPGGRIQNPPHTVLQKRPVTTKDQPAWQLTALRSYFGAHGHLPLGVALLLAAVLGILLW